MVQQSTMPAGHIGVVPPPPPPPPQPVAPPAKTSSPKKIVELPVYSPISEPDNSKSNITTSDIIMPESTIEVSHSASTANISSPNKVEIDVNNNALIDSDLPENDPNLETSSQNLATHSQNGNNTSLQGQSVPSKTFPENVNPLPQISIVKRVSTAYKYVPFQRKSLPEKKPSSEAHGSDEEPETSDEIRENSFPISSYILDAWQHQGKAFKSNLEEALIMSKKPKSEILPEQANESARKSSVDAEKSEDKHLFAKTFNSILKNRPQKTQGDFFYHKSKFAEHNCKFDGDIGKLAPTDFKPSGYKFDVHLTEDEVKSVQTASSFGLYAESHTTSYIAASRKAINQVLLKLDPETSAEDIRRLHDVKYMLYGAANAIDQSVRMLVYIHAGLTAQLRQDFLQAMGSFLPDHVRQGLLFEMFGGSGLFNSQIHKYVPDIKEYHDKLHKDQFVQAVAKALLASEFISSDGFRIPKLPQQQQPHDPTFCGCGRGDRGHGRGAGNQQQQAATTGGQTNTRGGSTNTKKCGRGGNKKKN